MSDLERKNAEAAKQGLEAHEERIQGLELKVATLTGHVQTLMGLITKLQQSNTLALQEIRGAGSTSGNNN